MSKIAHLSAAVIKDSRGDATIEVTLASDIGHSVKASVPQGKSRGSYEAASIDARFAVKSVEQFIFPAIRGIDPALQEKIDEAMCALDGTPNKSRLGGNAILAVSIGVARLAAAHAGMPLWRYLRNLSGISEGHGFPRLFVNVINGGLHAKNNLDIQEYLVIPRARRIEDAVLFSKKIYGATKTFFETREKGEIPVGDEGGFMPSFKNNEEPFAVLAEVLRRMEATDEADFGIDAAASNIRMEKGALTSLYERLIGTYGLLYIEDPFTEDDFGSFAELQHRFGAKTKIVGDDLTVTNIERMRRAKKHESVNGVIIKPNQVGTVTEAIRAVRLAREWGWQVVVSHRSGETLDDFIADFACGVGADGFKLGAPKPAERMAKYDRLIAIEKEASHRKRRIGLDG